VRRAYKFRLRPTARQHVALGQCLASHRELYNAALQERRDAWQLRRASVFYGDQSAQLNRAFAAFFRRVKAGETPGHPRFRSAQRFDSVEWPKDGDGCRWQPSAGRVYLQGTAHVKVTVHRRVEGRVKTIQVRREGRRWMLVLSCDDVPTWALQPTGAAVGIDVGIASFATTSDGRQVFNASYGRIAAAKVGLNRSIHDAGWDRFVSILRAKAEEAGRVVIDVDARHTSDRCEACGHTAAENRPSQAVFSCRGCGHTANADEHAARNILRAGLARLAATSAA
jgi:transposase